MPSYKNAGIKLRLQELVGMPRFDRGASCSQSRRANQAALHPVVPRSIPYPAPDSQDLRQPPRPRPSLRSTRPSAPSSSSERRSLAAPIYTSPPTPTPTTVNNTASTLLVVAPGRRVCSQGTKSTKTAPMTAAAAPLLTMDDKIPSDARPHPGSLLPSSTHSSTISTVVVTARLRASPSYPQPNERVRMMLRPRFSSTVATDIVTGVAVSCSA